MLPQYTYDMAKVQIIHNSADAIADSVDIYLNGAKAFDNVAFRTATPFIDLRAGVPSVIDIAPKNSSSVSESVYNLTTTLEKDKKYVIVANGIVSGSGYAPATPFMLHVYDMAMTDAPEGKTHVMVFHGATDAPTVDVVETAVPAGTIINDMPYGDFTGYLALGTLDYVLDVRDETGATTVASYAAPLQTLGLGGNALVVLASGFLNPANNSNGAAFGLYVALPTGGELVKLPAASTTPLKQKSEYNFSAYPNPFKGSLSVTAPSEFSGAIRFEITDMAGRNVVVRNAQSGSANIQLDLNNLKSGQYVLQITDSEERKAVKRINKL